MPLLHLERFAYGGETVGHLDNGKTCLIQGGIPGETIEFEITGEQPRLIKGKATRIISASATRIDPECAVFGSCPGCAYRHIPYQLEVKVKTAQWQELLKHSKIPNNAPIFESVASPCRDGMRNKLTPAALGMNGVVQPAWHGFDNKSLLPLPNCGCALAKAELNDLMMHDFSPDVAIWRYTEKDGAVAVSSSTPPLTEKINGTEFFVAANGFFQTNIFVAEKLVADVAKKLQQLAPVKVLELYCGVGVFSICAAKIMQDTNFTGVEINKEAIYHAKINARNAGVGNQCRFLAGNADKFPKLFNDTETILVDPPRSGISKKLRKILSQSSTASNLIYISCAPDTLVRDLKSLTAGNWELTGSGIYDMFPGTSHFETIAILKNIKSQR